MRFEETVEPIGDENFVRVIQTDQGPIEVEAFCDLRFEVTDGRHQGEVVEAFAFLVASKNGHDIRVTEKRTGKKLATIPVISSEGEFMHIPEELYERMLPAMCEMAKIASFERFREASEEQMQSYLEKIQQHPPVNPEPALH